MKQILTKNLVKSWKTTVIGLVILVAAIISIFLVDNINWLDASIGISIGLILLFAPDTLLQKIRSPFRRPNHPCE